MKLIVLPAILLGLSAAPEVRVEAGGVRVGEELVVAPSLTVLQAGARPILVSKSAVESLGAPLAVGIEGLALTLEPGVRLARAAEGYVLSTHGPDLVLSAGDKTLRAGASAAFRIAGGVFDFGPLGKLDGVLLARTQAAGAPQVVPPPRQDPVSPERRAIEASSRRRLFVRRIFGPGDPLVGNQAAIDKEVLVTSPQLSPFN